MNGSIAWFAENKVAANLLMMLILVAGMLTLPEIRKEVLPDFSSQMISITVPYPGASPSEVEKNITNKIESVIHGIEGINNLFSRSLENMALITIKVGHNYDVNELLEKVKGKVEGISDLPPNAEKPVVREIPIQVLVNKLVIAGEADERSLKNLAYKIRSDLLQKPGLSNVELDNVRSDEISIELSEFSLRRYDLSFSEVVSAIQGSSLDSSAGEVGQVSLGLQGKAQSGEDYEDIVLRSDPEGGRILLSDVAKVIDGFAQSNVLSRFNGKPAVALNIFRVGDQNLLKVSEIIESYVEHPDQYLPEGITLHIWKDSSRHFKSRIKLLKDNAIGGFLLILIILMLFLKFNLSFWTSLGIPVSFLGALWLMPYFGGSINMISMFAFLLVLGIVVDDAIIVGESIFTENNKGNHGYEGAVAGAKAVATPVIYAVITTMVAFSPLLFLPGAEGKLVQAIPVVVLLTLAVSLLESLWILPAHLSTNSLQKAVAFMSSKALQWLPFSRRINNALIQPVSHSFTAVQAQFSTSLENFVELRFRPFLEWVLKWRYAALSSFVAVFIIFLAMIATGWIKLQFFSEIEGEVAKARVEFATNTPDSVIENAIYILENAAIELAKELEVETGEEQIIAIASNTGIEGDSVGLVELGLAPSEIRSISGEEVSVRWRKKIGRIPDMLSLDIGATINQPGPDIDIELFGQDLDHLRNASNELKVQLAGFSGTYEIQDSFQTGQSEVYLQMKSAGRDLGLNLNDLAHQVRQAFHGVEVQRIQRKEEDIKVVVRYPETERNSLWHLENLSVKLPDGTLTPLLMVAEVYYGTGPSEIKHNDRKRVIRVQARVDAALNNDAKIMVDLRTGFFKQMAQDYPDIKWGLSGLQQNKQDIIDYMGKSFTIALLVMYMLMAALFRSYIQPLMVMFAIPFGLIGAMAGHLVLGLEVSIWSMVGMIAVSGVVVNDTLVLVDFINRNRLAGIPLEVAIREAGVSRFRPIILTSLTTFAGLTPLMLESSLQAQFMIPMAVSLSFGVMFATLVSLILVPAAYHVLDDIKVNLGIRDALHFVAPTAVPEPVVDVIKDNEPIRKKADISDPSTLQWHIGLDEAYNQGYALGLSGKGEQDCPYEEDELAASWEAGWDDGYEQYREDNNGDGKEVPA